MRTVVLNAVRVADGPNFAAATSTTVELMFVRCALRCCLRLQVGLWDINHTAAEGTSSDSDNNNSSSYDGVLMFEPHRDYVSSLKWLGPSGAGLLTGSYDGLVRKLDVETGGCVGKCARGASLATCSRGGGRHVVAGMFAGCSSLGHASVCAPRTQAML